MILGGGLCLERCAGLLATWGTTVLLLVEATDCSTTTTTATTH